MKRGRGIYPRPSPFSSTCSLNSSYTHTPALMSEYPNWTRPNHQTYTLIPSNKLLSWQAFSSSVIDKEVKSKHLPFRIASCTLSPVFYQSSIVAAIHSGDGINTNAVMQNISSSLRESLNKWAQWRTHFQSLRSRTASDIHLCCRSEWEIRHHGHINIRKESSKPQHLLVVSILILKFVNKHDKT